MIKPDIFVFSDEDHPRLRYVLDWIICDCWEKQYLLSTDEDAASRWSGPRIAYTQKPPPFRPWIHCHTNAFEDHNTATTPDVAWLDGQPWIFYRPASEASLPADVLASIFWLLSRQEEYTAYTPDQHDRFPASASLAYRHGFLQRPVVDEWVQKLDQKIHEAFPVWTCMEANLEVQSTYDIDYAWRYLHKPAIHQLRTLARDLVKEGPSVFLAGLLTTLGFQGDPYDLYTSWARQEAVLFFPLGDRSFWDRNHAWTHPEYRHLIRSCGTAGRIGIHPSYSTMTDGKLLEQEIQRFAEITGQMPMRSRQHYLRFRLPVTYRTLEGLGILEEWSMGFADQPGFRAGTSRTFRWYDLEQDRCTRLRIFPFQVMDTTLLHYLKLSPEEAAGVVDAIAKAIKNPGGRLTFLAHNNSLAGTDRIWRGWQNIWPQCQR